MQRNHRSILEVLLFTGGVVAYLWLRTWPWAIVIPVVLLVATALAFRARSEGVDSLGLNLRLFVRSLTEWRVWYLASLVGLVIIGGERLLLPGLLYRGFRYFLWCVVQQVLYQNMVAKPMLGACKTPARACGAAAALFAAVHAPNPVLIPATFVWGGLSCRMFVRLRSAVGLALLQTLLSSLLYWITPLAWHRGFRVGIGYFLR